MACEIGHQWAAGQLSIEVTTSDVGGFVGGDTVVAARDLRVRGKVVVRQAALAWSHVHHAKSLEDLEEKQKQLKPNQTYT